MITQHHVIGAGWMLWTVAAAVGIGIIFSSVPLPSWMVFPLAACLLAGLSWIIVHSVALAFWLCTRPQP